MNGSIDDNKKCQHTEMQRNRPNNKSRTVKHKQSRRDSEMKRHANEAKIFFFKGCRNACYIYILKWIERRPGGAGLGLLSSNDMTSGRRRERRQCNTGGWHLKDST